MLETQAIRFELSAPYNTFRVITYAEKEVADGYYDGFNTLIAQPGKTSEAKADYNTRPTNPNDDEEENVEFDAEQEDENMSPSFGEIIAIEEQHIIKSNDGQLWLENKAQEKPSRLKLLEETRTKIRDAGQRGRRKMSVDLTEVNAEYQGPKKSKGGRVATWQSELTPEQSKELGMVPAQSLIDHLS